MVLPTNVLLHLTAIPTPNASLGVDVPYWRWDNKQKFTTKFAYEFLHIPCDPKSNLWRLIWRLPVPQIVHTFMCLAVHGKILTNHECLRRHLAIFDTCSLFHDGIEDVVHVFRDCVRVRSIWAQVKIHKIDRDNNRMADALAGASRGSPIDEAFYTASPSFVQSLIMKGF
ncbi:hypothetical protein V6N12_049823 [Hibiscus sabdariffa]|uniref:Reverse transcriptase zinc-binding domain-containing protein n=1 Tax=Hibiscus sabdariffa TaxID=183260 RepID=A0ABR2GBR1_9ROSI